MKLDLHGVRHEEVEQKVVSFIEHNSCAYCELTIVTGHSPTMSDLVSKVLDEYKLEYHVGGVLGVSRTFIKVYM